MSTARIMIAHQDAQIRMQCAQRLTVAGSQVVDASGDDTYEILGLLNALQPDVLLLDLALAKGQGVSFLPLMRAKSPSSRVLLVVDGDSDEAIMAALADGAIGYLDRDALDTHIVKAVRVVNAGEAWVPRQMVARILEAVWSHALDQQAAAV
ncbi:MAG: response regulator [Gammaproteobacteria bacterium]|nr:response regulator [Gammaproteobacteria bacterium]